MVNKGDHGEMEYPFREYSEPGHAHKSTLQCSGNTGSSDLLMARELRVERESGVGLQQSPGARLSPVEEQGFSGAKSREHHMVNLTLTGWPVPSHIHNTYNIHACTHSTHHYNTYTCTLKRM